MSAAVLAAATPGRTAPAQWRFDIAPQPLPDALVRLALQAGVSIGGVEACPGRSSGLNGRYTLDQALRALLGPSGCGFVTSGERAVRILPPLPAARSRPAFVAVPMVSELLVTPGRRPQSPDEVPASVSLVQGRDLEAVGGREDADAVRQMAGVAMTNLGPGRDKMMIRGLSDGAFTGRTRTTVGAYLDSAPITYNAPDPDLLLVDVDAIEVVRGPQGALYGSGALSGVYRIVTRRPDPGALAGSLGAAASWTTGGDPGHRIQGVVNLPLLTDRAALRLVAYEELRGGYVDDLNLRLSNVDRTTRSGGRLGLRVLTDGGWTLDLGGAVQRLASNDTQYVTAGSLMRANRVREDHSNRFSSLAFTAEGPLSDGRLQTSTSYVRHRFSSRYDASAALSAFDENPSGVAVYQEGVRTEMLGQDLLYSSDAAGPVRWLAGASASVTRINSPSALDVRPLAGGVPRRVYTEARRDRLEGAAVFGEMSAEFRPGWTASVGGRVYTQRLRTQAQVDVRPPGQTRGFVHHADHSGFSPKVSLQVRLSDTDLAYALMSEGDRAGGFNSGGLLTPSPALAAYGPDHLRNVELGFKHHDTQDVLVLRAAAFYDVWTDIQTDQYLLSGLPYTANVGDGRNVGLEAEATWRPSPGWRIQVSGMVDHPRVTRVSPGFAGQKGAGLPGVSDLSVDGLVAYGRPVGPGLNLTLVGEAGYVGPSRLTFDPALSPRMGGYVTALLSAELSSARWRVAAHLENPANDAGDTFAYGNPFSFGQVRQLTPQRPRTFTLELSASF